MNSPRRLYVVYRTLLPSLLAIASAGAFSSLAVLGAAPTGGPSTPQKQAATNPRPAALTTSVSATAYPGYNVEPGILLTLKTAQDGTYKLGAVWDIELGRPGVFYSGNRSIMRGVSMVQTAAYTPWPTATGVGSTYGLGQTVGVKWASKNGGSTSSLVFRQFPEGALPARQRPDPDGRVEIVLAGSTSFLQASKSMNLWAVGSREIGNDGASAIGGVTVGSMLSSTQVLRGSISAGWSNRSHEFTMDGAEGPFAVAGTSLGWSGTEAVKASLGLRWSPKEITALAIPEFYAWAGPHVDYGWIGDRASLTEKTAASAGVVAGLDVGPPSEAMSVRVGVALPVTGNGHPSAYAYVSGAAF